MRAGWLMPAARMAGRHTRRRQLSRLSSPPCGAGKTSGVSRRGGIAPGAPRALAAGRTFRGDLPAHALQVGQVNLPEVSRSVRESLAQSSDGARRDAGGMAFEVEVDQLAERQRGARLAAVQVRAQPRASLTRALEAALSMR